MPKHDRASAEGLAPPSKRPQVESSNNNFILIKTLMYHDIDSILNPGQGEIAWRVPDPPRIQPYLDWGTAVQMTDAAGNDWRSVSLNMQCRRLGETSSKEIPLKYMQHEQAARINATGQTAPGGVNGMLIMNAALKELHACGHLMVGDLVAVKTSQTRANHLVLESAAGCCCYCKQPINQADMVECEGCDFHAHARCVPPAHKWSEDLGAKVARGPFRFSCEWCQQAEPACSQDIHTSMGGPRPQGAAGLQASADSQPWTGAQSKVQPNADFKQQLHSQPATPAHPGSHTLDKAPPGSHSHRPPGVRPSPSPQTRQPPLTPDLHPVVTDRTVLDNAAGILAANQGLPLSPATRPTPRGTALVSANQQPAHTAGPSQPVNAPGQGQQPSAGQAADGVPSQDTAELPPDGVHDKPSANGNNSMPPPTGGGAPAKRVNEKSGQEVAQILGKKLKALAQTVAMLTKEKQVLIKASEKANQEKQEQALEIQDLQQLVAQLQAQLVPSQQQQQ